MPSFPFWLGFLFVSSAIEIIITGLTSENFISSSSGRFFFYFVDARIRHQEEVEITNVQLKVKW